MTEKRISQCWALCEFAASPGRDLQPLLSYDLVRWIVNRLMMTSRQSKALFQGSSRDRAECPKSECESHQWWQGDGAALHCPVRPPWVCQAASGRRDRAQHQEHQGGDSPGPRGSVWTPGDTAADSLIFVLSCNILIQDTVNLLLETHPKMVGKYTAYGGMLYTHTPLHLASRWGINKRNVKK